MCKTVEAVITAVYHPASRQMDLWLTRSDERGQFELVGNLTDAGVDVRELFDRLSNVLERSFFGADPNRL